MGQNFKTIYESQKGGGMTFVLQLKYKQKTKLVLPKGQQNGQCISSTDQEKAQVINAKNEKGNIAIDAAVFKHIKTYHNWITCTALYQFILKCT